MPWLSIWDLSDLCCCYCQKLHTYAVSICVEVILTFHSKKPWKILMFQVLAKSFISKEGQIRIRWVGEKGRVGENICNASPVTGGRHKGWTLSARHWTHYKLILIASRKIWEGDPTSRSWNWEMSKNFSMDGASGEGVARLRSSVSNSNIVNMHNAQYDKCNVKLIIINLGQHCKIFATAHQLIKSL